MCLVSDAAGLCPLGRGKEGGTGASCNANMAPLNQGRQPNMAACGKKGRKGGKKERGSGWAPNKQRQLETTKIIAKQLYG